MKKIIKNDEVIIITGKDKGRRGKVLRVIDNKFVVVEGVNQVKKHLKPNPKTGAQGGIIDKEAKLPLSNVAVVNPMTKKADRVGFKILENGNKVRYFKSNNEMIDTQG